MRRIDVINLIVLTILSLLFTADLFLWMGRPITFDGQIHLVTMGQFAQALAAGDFPVVWTDTFANYGIPLGIVAHQTSSYLGALFFGLTGNLLTAYNLVALTGTLLAAGTVYWWLRLETEQPTSALLGTMFYLLAPYRILNLYIRGAIPEHLVAGIVPLVLIGMHLALRKKQFGGWFLVVLGYALIALTHHMVLVISAFLIGPYFLYTSELPTSRSMAKIRRWFLQALLPMILASGLGLVMAGYYLLPLVIETKYLVHGTVEHALSPGKFLHLEAFFNPQWYYFGTHPGPRGEFIKLGLWESLVLVGTAGFLFIKKKSLTTYPQLWFWLATAGVLIFLVLPWSTPVYNTLPYLSQIQFPYRMLTPLLFIPAILVAHAADQIRKPWLLLGLMLIIFANRFPQLYTKNVLSYDHTYFMSSIDNLHTDNMNPIWIGTPREYPRTDTQVEIVEGDGTLSNLEHTNSRRTFTVRASSDIRLLDRTFYFPGWEATVNDQPAVLEFQDPSYRGLLTVRLPAGEHQVTIRFTDTKVRLAAKLISAIGLSTYSLLVVIWLLQKHGAVANTVFRKRSS